MTAGAYMPQFVNEYQIIEETFNGSKRRCIPVNIDAHEYELCENTSNKWWANSKTGTYGRGLCRTSDDPCKPVRTGLLGQMAYGKLFHAPVDLAYRRGGDAYDTLIGDNLKVDIKCATRNYGKGLIYQRNEWGDVIPVDKDIYVFSYVQSDDRINRAAVVIMVGFMLNTDVKQCPVKPGKYGRHFNYEVHLDCVRSIVGLLELVRRKFPSPHLA